MYKCSDLFSFLEKSTGAPHSDEDGYIALASNNSFNYFLVINYYRSLCLYIDFCTDSGLLLEVSHICFQASGWVVHVWPTYQGIHSIIYIIPYIKMPCFSHPHLVSVELLLLEGFYLHTIYLTETTWVYLMFLIIYCM